eukprot:Clim_evm5s136 gene=Clim_evmTU5s136
MSDVNESSRIKVPGCVVDGLALSALQSCANAVRLREEGASTCQHALASKAVWEAVVNAARQEHRVMRNCADVHLNKKVSSKNESNSAPSAPTSITFNFHQHVTHNHHQYNDNRQVHNTIHILAIPGSFVFGANPQKPMIAANGGSGGLQLLSQEESQQFIVESQNARRGSHPEPIDPRQLSMAFLTAFSEIMNQLGDPNAQEALEQLFDPNVEAEFAGQYVQGSQAVKQFFLSTGQSRWVFDETNMQAHYNGQAYILQVSCQLTSATLNETKVVGLIAQLVEVAPKHVVINRVAVTG